MTERKPSIRKLENDDELMAAVPIVMEAAIECAKSLGKKDLPKEDEAITHLRCLSNSRGDFWVAELDGRIVGYTEGYSNRKNKGEYVSQWVYVNPENRRNGLGKALKQAQLQRARELGCVYLHTFVDPENQASLSLQRSLGAQLKPLLTSVSSKINL